MKTGVLLINLGTPDAPTVAAVRRYLAQFLADKRVLDIPTFIRYALLYGIILPFRPRRSAHAYQAIWQAEGSPLMIHSKALCHQVQQALGDQFVVQLGMRYGNPSIESALQALIAADCQQLSVLPLFPQYAAASGGSAVAEFLHAAQQYWNLPAVTILGDFFANELFINALYTQLLPVWQQAKPEVTLLSFHSLPERHLSKSGCTTAFCQRQAACPPVKGTNRFCYRAQCFATARALASKLKISESDYRVCFQSRLGRIPWVGPDFDSVLKELAKQGVKNIAVACPSFVADCLETLEEVGMRGKEQWQALGGQQLTLLPCLNDHPAWVMAVASWLKANKI